MSLEINPIQTYQILLIVQALHLLHHRIAKRHISFAEVIGGLILCFPPMLAHFPDWLYITSHLAMTSVQIIGSLWIKKLSPSWESNTRLF